MSRWLPDRPARGLALGIAADGCALRDDARGGGARHQAWPKPWARLSATEVVATLDALAGAGAPRGRACRLALAEDLVRYWIVEPPAGTRSLAELRAVALARGARLFGDASGKDAGLPGWRVEAAWDAARPFLASAVPAAIADGVEAWARRERVDLGAAGLATPLLHLLPRLRPAASDAAWLCVTWPECTQLILLRQRRVAVLRVLRPGPAAPLASRLADAAEELRREQLRGGPTDGLPAFWVNRDASLESKDLGPTLSVDGGAVTLTRLGALAGLPSLDDEAPASLAMRYARLAALEG